MPVVIEVQIIGGAQLIEQLSAAPKLLEVESGAAMRSSLAVAESEVKAFTPRKTGRLFSAWQPSLTTVDGHLVGHLTNDVEYAPEVEDGSGPHEIVAHGNALMIPVAGGGGFGGGRLSGRARSGQQVAFFKRVQHPGTKGVQMAKRGLEAAKPEIQNLFVAAVNRVLATIKGAL